MKIYKDTYKFKIFNDQKIICAVSTRNFGSIKTRDGINQKNLKKFFAVLGVDARNIIFPNQVHGSNLRFVKNLDINIPNADGLITDKKNLFLGNYEYDQ